MMPILTIRRLLKTPPLFGYPVEMLATIAREVAREMAHEGFRRLDEEPPALAYYRLMSWARGSFDAGFRPA